MANVAPILENLRDPVHDREKSVETPAVFHEIRYRVNRYDHPAQAVTTGLRSRRVDVVPHGRGISPPTLACRPEGVAEPSVSMNSVPMRGISSRRHVWHRCRIRSRRPSEEPRIGECRSPNTRTPFIWPIPPSAQTVAAPTTADSVTGTVFHSSRRRSADGPANARLTPFPRFPGPDRDRGRVQHCDE